MVGCRYGTEAYTLMWLRAQLADEADSQRSGPAKGDCLAVAELNARRQELEQKLSVAEAEVHAISSALCGLGIEAARATVVHRLTMLQTRIKELKNRLLSYEHVEDLEIDAFDGSEGLKW